MATRARLFFLLGGRIRIDGGRIEACDSECTAIKAMALYYNKEYYPTSAVLNEGEVIGSDWGISVIGIGKENCQTTVEIHGGTVEAQNGAAIAGNGTNDKQKCCAWTNIVITDGVIRGATAMYLPQYGTTRITGGIITGTEAAIEIVSGKLIMTDGTLILDSEDRNLTFDPDRSNGTACRGAALAVVARTKDGEQGYQNGLYWGKMEISISGGEIEGNYTVFEGLSEACSTEASIKKFEITGGKFTGEVLLENGLKEKIQDGTYNGISGGYFSGDVEEGYIKPGCKLPKEDENKRTEDSKDNGESGSKENGSESGGNSGTVYREEYHDDSDDDSIVEAESGQWKRDTLGWWYQMPDGSYLKNTWRKLYYNGVYRWYHFGANGYMNIGWFTDLDGNVYYLNPVSDGLQGAMAYGLQNIDGTWHRFMQDENGKIPFGALIRE